MTLEASGILERARAWATGAHFDAETRQEVQGLLDRENHAELGDRFYRDLEFGTGGLRGIMGAGTARMNLYNVRRASFALGSYVREVYGPAVHGLSVGISYDSRINSRRFAEASAEVFAGLGLEVVMTQELRPVPMLSFLVRHFRCAAGICLTASHNPPDYNGYKVYWTSGAQVTPPHDAAIIQRYNEATDYGAIPRQAFDEGVRSGRIRLVGEELDREYFRRVESLSFWDGTARPNLKVVMTPLHGTGGYPVREALRRYGFHDVHLVPEQERPDGSFPTVASPNPEDPKAFEYALREGKRLGADILLATDPDCDRIGLGVKEGDDYWLPNGNQIGALLTEYVLSRSKALARLPKDALFITTVVTSDLQRRVAESYGCFVETTLTGFKWICQVIDEYERGERVPLRIFVCGGEESYGFLAGDFVRDKDGVIACALVAEMTAWYRAQGQSLRGVLYSLFRRHGVFVEDLITVTLPGQAGAAAIQDIMARFRRNPPSTLDGVAVAEVRDLNVPNGFTLRGASRPLPRSNVLQFVLVDGSILSVRPSGTEPKIKFYTSLREEVAPETSDRVMHACEERGRQRAQRIATYLRSHLK